MNKNKLPLVLTLFFLTHFAYVIAGTTPPPLTPSPSPSPSPTPEVVPSATPLAPPTATAGPTDSSSSPALSPDSSSTPSALPTSSIEPSNFPESPNSPQGVKTPEESPIKKEEETKAGTNTRTEEKAHPHDKSRYIYSSVHVSGPYIAMTFDDGPHASLTPKLLDMLKAREIKATFFLIGENVVHYPHIVKRMVNEGHEVANHTWSHPSLTKCSSEKFNHEIKATNEAIEAAAGIRPTLIRPPYGATNANLNRIMNEKYGLKVILWSVDPMDWKYRNTERVASHIPPHTKAGDIILAHDIHATTVEAMPKVLDALLAKGFKFLTVSELISHQTAAPPSAKKASSPQQHGAGSSSHTHFEATPSVPSSSSPGSSSSDMPHSSSSLSPPPSGSTSPIPLPAETPEP